MSLAAYAHATSIEQGGTLAFRLIELDGLPVRGRVRITDQVSGAEMLDADVHGQQWTVQVPHAWPSSLYRVRFTPAAGADGEVYFAVRAVQPGRNCPVLVSVPFATWQAYNRLGVPGECLYATEGPDRASRVSFDRPGGGPAGHWEDRLLRWLGETGHTAEFCSNLDLDMHGTDLVGRYQLLVCLSHDEYWTAPMRDAVETFVDHGGNVAFFGGNTAWWQARLEDGGRTLVCYRDALADPVGAHDPSRTTVEWSSAPVHRPENSLTGVSFRAGAGCWENFEAMKSTAYTAVFADHWVFAGTGLRDGAEFAAGAVGYETDAAETELVRGVPRVTGRDGTPGSFVVLASAVLTHWARYGQGGRATMGVFRRGAGTVFNAATVGWSNAIDDPVVDRITRNVLARLSRPCASDEWEPIGRCAGLRALVVCAGVLWAIGEDGILRWRELCAQNLPWCSAGSAGAVIALAAPREGISGFPVGLVGATAGGRLRFRLPERVRGGWSDVGTAPDEAEGLAAVHDGLFAVTARRELWRLPLGRLIGDPADPADPAEPVGPDDGSGWRQIATVPDDPGGEVPCPHVIAGMNGRLYGLARDGRVLAGAQVAGSVAWSELPGALPGACLLAAHGGRLIAGGPDGRLWWRDVTAAGRRRFPEPAGGPR